jgi:penicillin-binding protein 1B
VLLGTSLGTSFGLYLWSVYQQLTDAFSRQEQLVPTRIYSDLTQIRLHERRSSVEERLKSLGYHYQRTQKEILFTLHPPDYPLDLIPADHPQLKDSFITLEFEESKSHLLESIHVGQKSASDVYLEPEMVATWTQNGSDKKEIRTYRTFDQMPAMIWKAIIAVEDQHFLDHKGLDPRAIARAIWVNVRTRSLAQGGSTITQQLVKNLLSRRTKNIFKKANELFLSLLLELRFEKEQILERYLNEVYLGQVGNLEVHGVAEGAEHFFGKKIEDLNVAEIALMAGLIRGPNYYSPYHFRERAMERQKLVLKKMIETGLIAEEEAIAARSLPIRLAPPQYSVTKAPFFTDSVKMELARILRNKLGREDAGPLGLRVYTTLDLVLNSAAQKTVSDGIRQLQTRYKTTSPKNYAEKLNQNLEGALVSIDQHSGFIKTVIGGKNYAESNFNRILNMKRQVGSTFKPIVYLTAFAQGRDAQGIPFAPGRPAQDASWSWVYDRDQKTWSPRNYDSDFLGWISLRTALAQSVNTVSARLAAQVGLDAIIETGKKLGIESSLPHLPSLALGITELSPIELLKVYATLANRGVQPELTMIRSITLGNGDHYYTATPTPTQVMEPAPIDLLTDTLQSVFTQGTAQSARKMGFNRSAAGKTGTTNNHRDAWFAGYTPEFTTVVWVGMDQTSEKVPPPPLTGANSALPIWVSFMKTALKEEPDLPVLQSLLLTQVTIDTHTGAAATSSCPAKQITQEMFIRGQEPQTQTCEPNWPTPQPSEMGESFGK